MADAEPKCCGTTVQEAHHLPAECLDLAHVQFNGRHEMLPSAPNRIYTHNHHHRTRSRPSVPGLVANPRTRSPHCARLAMFSTHRFLTRPSRPGRHTCAVLRSP